MKKLKKSFRATLMNKGELAAQIRKTWEYSKAVGIGEIFSNPSALHPSERFRSMSVDENISYEELYLCGLRDGQYNICLKDFSFFQYGLGKEEGDVRYAYYPNPFLGAAPDAVAEVTEMQEYVSEGIIDVDEFLHRIAEVRRPRHPPLVRYEYSKKQYVEDSHPCSHLHLGYHGENRWPVRRYLSAHAFTLLIMRIFYGGFWATANKVRHGPDDLDIESILEISKNDCRLLYAEEFSEREEKRFFFS
ncbi:MULTISPECIES: DUF2290 domain-containing protein [unclassified Sphingobium]|uniref:DUF2290 domain-containing protein n=1 Tax=unclassified Sphingobium TaxID=2611147 RepID=UPI002224BB16|nr:MULTISPECIES: DUF2290 domain-containing protein [unclassified Sphingobium]MCW2411797.1 hypothetical protein [Sphingobium sp. B8D3D]MCW2415905.1 hypothetical protein [Sphingobium sp. B8D3A]